MSARLVNVDRQTPLLLPPDLRDWIPSDDMVHFVVEAVEGMKLSKLRVNERGTGSEQYPPAMMLSLLVYCYANGVFGSRRIERATYRDIAVRYLTGDTHPDHDTICKFRRENFDVVAESFLGILLLAKELGVLKVGVVSTDGTKLNANANKHCSVTYQRAGELVEQLKQEVHELLRKAEAADNAEREEGQQLPEEIARRDALKAKLEQARERLEDRARKKAQSEQAEYERKVKAREQRKGSRKGPKIQPPKTRPGPTDQINLTDSDSRLMRKNKRSSYEQSYNPQLAVDAEGSQLILSCRASNNASDSHELAANIEAIPEQVGKPTAVLADTGYACEEEVALVREEGIEVYVSTGAESKNMRRRHDFRPAHRRKSKDKVLKAQWLLDMKAKMETDAGRALYARRKQTVEPVFGIIKNVMGFRQFNLRDLPKVDGEWQLISLAYNVKRLWKLKMAM
jgi:transposase